MRVTAKQLGRLRPGAFPSFRKGIRPGMAGQRPKPGVMNKPEAAYLDYLHHVNGILAAHYEAVTLQLPGGFHFRPDFLVLDEQGRVEFHDVKVMWSNGRLNVTDDAKLKMRLAAATFPYFRFAYAWQEPRSRVWRVETVAP